MLWIVSWSNLDGEWSVVSQRVLVTPHWIGDHQIKGHKYPTIYTQIRTNIPLLIHKYSTTNAQIPNQLYTNTVTNTQPLLLRLSCIPCTNILRPHYKMKGTDNTLITTNIYQYTPISEKRSHNTFLKKMFGMLSLLAISSPFNTDSRIALV